MGASYSSIVDTVNIYEALPKGLSVFGSKIFDVLLMLHISFIFSFSFSNYLIDICIYKATVKQEDCDNNY